MFGMTRDTTDTSGHVWLDYGRNKGFSVVTRRTIPFHAPGEGVTTGAGVCIGLHGDWWKETQVRFCMRARDRRRSVSTCIPVSGGEGKQAHNDRAPDEKRDRPMRLQISCWGPVKLGFSGASLTLRKERRGPHHFSGLANSFVPKNVECFIARKWGCACFRMG